MLLLLMVLVLVLVLVVAVVDLVSELFRVLAILALMVAYFDA